MVEQKMVITGHELLNRVCDALGLGVRVRRVVIDIDLKGAATAYVQQYVGREQADALAEALVADPPTVVLVRDISIDKEGNVTTG